MAQAFRSAPLPVPCLPCLQGQLWSQQALPEWCGCVKGHGPGWLTMRGPGGHLKWE